jgi:hypothetical protein
LLNEALRQVSDRHPALRTFFAWKRVEKPYQIVRKQVAPLLEAHDWRFLTPGEQEQKLAALFEAERRRGFDPAKAPLVRLNICRRSDTESQFVWNYHPLVMDQWSLEIISREVLIIHDALLKGEDIRLAHGYPYKEFVNWSKRQDVPEAPISTQQLFDGLSDAPGLDLARPLNGSVNDSHRLVYQRTQLSGRTTSRLRALVREHKLGLNTFFLGAWIILLSRYSREQEVVLEITLSGRPAAAQEWQTTCRLSYG